MKFWNNDGAALEGGSEERAGEFWGHCGDQYYCCCGVYMGVDVTFQVRLKWNDEVGHIAGDGRG
jgi:hypothetical protein